MSTSLPTRFEAIDARMELLNAARPLPAGTVASLREKMSLEWTYHSNGIEGNTLTLRETKVVLEGITVGGKSFVEHCEAINHSEAIEYVEQLINDGAQFSEWEIKNLHRLVLKNINDVEAGRYRRENVTIAGASTTPPDFVHLASEMAALMEWYDEAAALHPIARSAELHTRFVKIHPFLDGNGRTGRLLMNFELMKSGYPPAILRKEDRLAYYDTLDHACLTDDFEPVSQLVADAVERSLSVYLKLLGVHPETPRPEVHRPKPSAPRLG